MLWFPPFFNLFIFSKLISIWSTFNFPFSSFFHIIPPIFCSIQPLAALFSGYYWIVISLVDLFSWLCPIYCISFLRIMQFQHNQRNDHNIIFLLLIADIVIYSALFYYYLLCYYISLVFLHVYLILYFNAKTLWSCWLLLTKGYFF